VRRALYGWNSENVTLNRAEAVLAFSVADTGIGIPVPMQKIIFEAFQQGDGSTNRKYGGTGLGLTISREIARMLGGEIQLQSSSAGSVFTLYLPQCCPEQKVSQLPAQTTLALDKTAIDDRDLIHPGERVLLSVEDDTEFAICLRGLAREAGFRVLTATRGQEALTMVRQYKPDVITLDLTLPDIDGWKVLEILKGDSATRHIPVVIISVDSDRNRGLNEGAAAYLVKPVSIPAIKSAIVRVKSLLQRRQKELLVVQTLETDQASVNGWAANNQVRVTAVSNGQSALSILKVQQFDCMVLNLSLSDMSGLHLLKEIKKFGCRHIPVLLQGDRELTPREQTQLHALRKSMLIKEVHSPERLLDQAALFLHLSIARLPESKRRVIEELHSSDRALADKKVLIVDDDIRNIFALTSLLERHQMRISSAETGQQAIQLLRDGYKPDIALVDIMMPGLDGYETMRMMRQINGVNSLPIIAVTAKAMREDRLKCLHSGASDYVPKPVDPQQLLSSLRCWLHR
jgi:CheY-like chemotaxis protein